METYVALLRGINLGSRNKIAMAGLRALVAGLGGEDVRTYVQSGNVVFRSPARSSAEVEQALEKRIKGDLSLAVRVLVRTETELRDVASQNPFAERGAEPAALHVAFLDAKPEAARARELESTEAGKDECRVLGREVYLHCPDGYGRTKLNNAYLEKRLAVAATTRNWRTVTRLVELAFG